MFAALAATGLIGGAATSPGGLDEAAGPTGGSTITTLVAPQGVVAVRTLGAKGTTFGTGLVFNTGGDIVTTLPASDGLTTGMMSVDLGDSRWSDATVIGTDQSTGLTVLRPPTPGMNSVRRPITTAAVTAAPALGGRLDLVRPGSGVVGARSHTDPAVRVASTNTAVAMTHGTRVGLLTLTSARPAAVSEVGLDRATGSVAALIIPFDDNVEDEMSYAVSAEVAVSIARQIEATSTAHHGELGALLTATENAGLMVAAVIPTAVTPTGLAVGDELLSVEGRPVHTVNDVRGVLVGVPPGNIVDVTVRRDSRQRVLQVTLGSSDGTSASTTTAP